MNIYEINAIREAARKRERARQKFEAMLHKNINIDEDTSAGVPTFDEIKRRAESKNRGISEEEIEFGEIGIQIIEE